MDASDEEKSYALDTMIMSVWANLFHNVRPEPMPAPQPKEKGRGKQSTASGGAHPEPTYDNTAHLDEKGRPLPGYRILTEEDKHMFCPRTPDTWCKFHRNDGTYVADKYLDPCFAQALYPIFLKLADEEYLRRLLSHE